MDPADRRLARDGLTITAWSVLTFLAVQGFEVFVLGGSPAGLPLSTAAMTVQMAGVTAWVTGFLVRSNGGRWEVPHAACLVIAGVLAFGLADFTASLVLGANPDYHPILNVGMIFPLAVVMGYFVRRDRIPGGKIAVPRPNMRTMAAWMLLEGALVVIASVAVFAFLEFLSNRVFHLQPTYQPVLAIGMIAPMGFIMGLISYQFSRRTNRYLARLTDGITRVAGGDFGVELDPRQAGPLKEVFADFNKMTRELRNVQILKDDFINAFSHEFKTPITSIHGFATLLRDVPVTEAERNQYLQIIAEESARLADLATRTLQLSRLEAQQLVADKTTFALDEQLKQCAILLSVPWGAKGIALTAHLEPVTWYGSPELLQQVWINLLTNAIRFTPEGGTITLGLKQDGNNAVVSVQDTGVGIAAADLPRIFDKYFQADPSRSGKGLGLGLAIVRRIVELCGGRIEVTSVLGAGTTFVVRLPGPGVTLQACSP